MPTPQVTEFARHFNGFIKEVVKRGAFFVPANCADNFTAAFERGLNRYPSLLLSGDDSDKNDMAEVSGDSSACVDGGGDGDGGNGAGVDGGGDGGGEGCGGIDGGGGDDGDGDGSHGEGAPSPISCVYSRRSCSSILQADVISSGEGV